jgi:hypothetical protein
LQPEIANHFCTRTKQQREQHHIRKSVKIFGICG